MTQIIRILALIVGLMSFGSHDATAQEDERGYLQALLEDNLSDVGRDIKITGFSGAFSSNATVEQITVADDAGVWLTLNGVDLSWTRSSLLRGVINISQLAAKEIIIARRPQPIGGVPAPEATGFSLPDIPVSVEIGQILAQRVELGAPVFGESAVVRLTGHATLSDGNGAAGLEITRIDGKNGRLALDGAYTNANRQLDLDMAVTESANGIAANLLDIPGRPAIDLTIKGNGALSDFTARIALKTDGQDRLNGTFAIKDKPVTGSSSDDVVPVAQHFSADIAGDIAPIFAPEYRAFFGQNVALVASGQRQPDGGVILDRFDLDTDALDLSGNLSLADDGWPQRFFVTGRIDGQSQQPVLLPLSGPKTFLRSADLMLNYDTLKGDEWQAGLTFHGLKRDDIALEGATLNASGTLARQGRADIGSANGQIAFDVNGIAPQSADLARAIGSVVSGHVDFDWSQDGPLRLSGLDLRGNQYRLSGNLLADNLKTGIDIRTHKDLVLEAHDLSRFSDLAGRALSGAIKLGVNGQANLLGGAFDLSLRGDGNGLSINEKRFDPLIAGQSKINLSAKRDESGTRVDLLKISTDQATATLSADLKTGRSSGMFDIQITDTSVIEQGLSGPATAKGKIHQTGDDWSLSAQLTAPGDLSAAFEGSVPMISGKPGIVKAQVTGKAASIAPYSKLAGQKLSGGVNATASGEYDPSSGVFQAALRGQGDDLKLGIPSVDDLLGATSHLSARLHRNDKQVIFLDALRLNTSQLKVNATGQSTQGRNSLSFDAHLNDLGVIADDIHGPASARGTAVLSGDTWNVSIDADGPGGTKAQIDGDVNADASGAALNITGKAPLALANRLIKPRRLTGQAAFDLSLNGPIGLASLNGSVRTQNARLALPTLRQAVDLDNATATLSGGQARIAIDASVATGGQMNGRGNIRLEAPFQTNMELAIKQVALTDGKLVNTVVDGLATLRGPLTQGATLRADLSLGTTEIQIADVPAGSVAILEKLKHINEPKAVRQTRSFAGLIVQPQTQSSSVRPYPIDILVRAPNKLFVRGRGLDAELGGQVRLTGTSANIVPVGQFNLVRGRLDILGKRLKLNQGRVELQGGFDPYLQFQASSENQFTEVFINITGPASAPEVTFTSNPELPQDEVLAQLLFGRKITEISPLQALKLASAVRTLAGKGGDGIVGNLRNNFALDDLDLSTNAEGETTLKAGKYISENIYTDVAVGSDGNTEVNLNLNISPSFTARGSVNAKGDSSLGVFFEKDY